MIASFDGKVELVKLLLKHKAKADPQEYKRVTALMLASTNGHADVVKLLHKYGAQVDLQDNKGVTALMLASLNGHAEVVKLLHEYGAQVDQQNNNGWTALMLASQNGHAEVVKLLHEYGAQVDLQKNAGQTALMSASLNGHDEVVKLLHEYGAQVDLQYNDGVTALMWASQNGHAKVVKLLHVYGAQVDLQNNGGVTALMVASQNGHAEVVKLLHEYGNKKKSVSMLESETEPISMLQSGCTVKDKRVEMTPGQNGHHEQLSNATETSHEPTQRSITLRDQELCDINLTNLATVTEKDLQPEADEERINEAPSKPERDDERSTSNQSQDNDTLQTDQNTNPKQSEFEVEQTSNDKSDVDKQCAATTTESGHSKHFKHHIVSNTTGALDEQSDTHSGHSSDHKEPHGQNGYPITSDATETLSEQLKISITPSDEEQCDVSATDVTTENNQQPDFVEESHHEEPLDWSKTKGSHEESISNQSRSNDNVQTNQNTNQSKLKIKQAAAGDDSEDVRQRNDPANLQPNENKTNLIMESENEVIPKSSEQEEEDKAGNEVASFCSVSAQKRHTLKPERDEESIATSKTKRDDELNTSNQSQNGQNIHTDQDKNPIVSKFEVCQAGNDKPYAVPVNLQPKKGNRHLDHHEPTLCDDTKTLSEQKEMAVTLSDEERCDVSTTEEETVDKHKTERNDEESTSNQRQDYEEHNIYSQSGTSVNVQTNQNTNPEQYKFEVKQAGNDSEDVRRDDDPVNLQANESETNLIVESENEVDLIPDCAAQEADKAGKGAASSISGHKRHPKKPESDDESLDTSKNEKEDEECTSNHQSLYNDNLQNTNPKLCKFKVERSNNKSKSRSFYTFCTMSYKCTAIVLILLCLVSVVVLLQKPSEKCQLGEKYYYH